MRLVESSLREECALTVGALASLLSWSHYMDLFRRVFAMVVDRRRGDGL